MLEEDYFLKYVSANFMENGFHSQSVNNFFQIVGATHRPVFIYRCFTIPWFGKRLVSRVVDRLSYRVLKMYRKPEEGLKVLTFSRHCSSGVIMLHGLF